MTDKPTVLFGPEPSKNPLNSGSWKWFGIDLANELSKYYNIIFQKNAETLKQADCYVVIKCSKFLQRTSKLKCVYIAVDKLRYKEEARFVRKCEPDWIVLNNEQFYIDWFKDVSNSLYIPHHIKYFYDGHKFEDRLEYVSWQGMEGNYKYVKEYLEQNYVDVAIRFLLSGKERNASKSWEYLDYKSGLFRRTHIGWSEERMRNELCHAGGFLDIKGSDFHQRYKPATKVLDALASGVPTAINDCGIRRYMETLGIELAYPTDTEKWFSRDYYDYTQGLKWRIREEFNVEKIALQYKEVIDQVLSNV